MSLTDSIKKAITKKLPAVAPTDSLRNAIKAMTGADASAIVVIAGEELTGIVTELDLMIAVADKQNLDTTQVLSVMSACDLITDKGAKTPCIQLDSDESVESALGVMNEAGVHHLLVSGGSGEAIGLVSAKDLLRIAAS